MRIGRPPTSIGKAKADSLMCTRLRLSIIEGYAEAVHFRVLCSASSNLRGERKSSRAVRRRKTMVLLQNELSANVCCSTRECRSMNENAPDCMRITKSMAGNCQPGAASHDSAIQQTCFLVPANNTQTSETRRRIDLPIRKVTKTVGPLHCEGAFRHVKINAEHLLPHSLFVELSPMAGRPVAWLMVSRSTSPRA